VHRRPVEVHQDRFQGRFLPKGVDRIIGRIAHRRVDQRQCVLRKSNEFHLAITRRPNRPDAFIVYPESPVRSPLKGPQSKGRYRLA
jgi:hypothetical protein